MSLFFSAFARAISLMVQHRSWFLGFASVYFFSAFFLGYFTKAGTDLSAFMIGASLGVSLFLGLVSLFQIKLVDHLFHGQSFQFSDGVEFAKSQFFRYFFVSLLWGFIVMVGIFLLILPGIYFFFVYLFAPLFVVLDGEEIFSSLQASRKLVFSHLSFSLGVAAVSAVGFLSESLQLGVQSHSISSLFILSLMTSIVGVGVQTVVVVSYRTLRGREQVPDHSTPSLD